MVSFGPIVAGLCALTFPEMSADANVDADADADTDVDVNDAFKRLCQSSSVHHRTSTEPSTRPLMLNSSLTLSSISQFLYFRRNLEQDDS